MSLTTEQFWNMYGRPKLYNRSISQSASGSTLTIEPITEVSGYARYADFFISTDLNVKLPAGDTATLSEYFPFNLLDVKNSVGGVVQQGYKTYNHYLEMLTREENGGDPAYVGEGGAGGNDVSSSIWDLSNNPGSSIGSSSSTASQSVTVNAKYWFRFYFQQNPVDKNSMYGCMPLGSPTFRPQLTLSIPDSLVSNNPWLSPVVYTGSGSVSATISNTTGTVVWMANNIPVLPVDVNGKPNPNIPANMVPTIGMARFTATHIPDGVPLGASIPFNHRVAMIYHKIFHNVVVNSKANTTNVQKFYLSTNGADDGVIWKYDDPNLASYHVRNLRKYGRYLPSGVLVADFQSGHLAKSQEGSEFMTPDQTLAAAFNLPLTPTMQTGIQLASSASPGSGAVNFISQDSIGLQNVSY